MELYRFYVPDLRPQAAEGAIALPPDQGHHAQSVLRLNTGDRVVLFDGAGAWVEAALDRLTKSGVTASLKGEIHVESPAAIQLTLATAVPKGERAEWLVEQASQLNAAAIQWLACDRSVVKPREGGGKIDKWRRLAVESAKQCGRAHLMRIQEMVTLKEVLAGKEHILWLDPGTEGTTVASALGDMRDGSVVAQDGPEGGGSDSERGILEAAVRAESVRRVRLTDTVLRIETACAAVAATVMAR